ncbi:MAG TPA: hypothetical protein VK195_03970 [Burkholderiaceae bacterium]|nr:hypothetical protein [Burkholderiaceae bacterium]
MTFQIRAPAQGLEHAARRIEAALTPARVGRPLEVQGSAWPGFFGQ